MDTKLKTVLWLDGLRASAAQHPQRSRDR